MNFKDLLHQLKQLGYTQTAVAQAVGSPISTINDLANGKTETPSFDLGTALVALHAKASAPKPKRKAAKEKA